MKRKAILPANREFKSYDLVLTEDEVNQVVTILAEKKQVVINRDWLYEQYITKLQSCESIARSLRNVCTGATVAKNLKKYKIERTAEQKMLANLKKGANARITTQQTYGVDNISQLEEIKAKKRDTAQKRYGVDNSLQAPEVKAKIRNTNLERYGVENVAHNPEIAAKIAQTNLKRYGAAYSLSSPKIRTKIEQTVDEKRALQGLPSLAQVRWEKAHRKELHIAKYGSLKHDAPLYLEAERKTCLEKYGVPYYCMTEHARSRSGNNSKPNQNLQVLLEELGVAYEREFCIDNFSYDFKVGNILLEVDPTATHNSSINVFHPSSSPLRITYHQEKTREAEAANYRCIHIWDWDDVAKIAASLVTSKKLYARQTQLTVLTPLEANSFLDLYHFQGSCKGNKVNLGLSYAGELIQVATFGKPRYNKNYEWELLRLCTHPGYVVVGGAERIFKNFIKNHCPRTILSYCDRSKFRGEVYSRLGFHCIRQGQPSRHWAQLYGKKHFTDNLLRAQGADRLIGTSAGKGSSNRELMLASKFVEIYDCGQDTWVWKSPQSEYYDDLQKEFDDLCKVNSVEDSINKILTSHTEITKEDFDSHIKLPEENS